RDAEHTRDFVLEIANFCGIPESILDLTEDSLARNARGGKQDLLVQMRRRIARDPYVVQLLRPNAGRLKTIFDSLSRKPRGVLEPIKPLLLRGRDQFPVASNRRGGIAVISVNTENVHPRLFA